MSYILQKTQPIHKPQLYLYYGHKLDFVTSRGRMYFIG
jgi:hypothetical protein